MKKRFSNGRFGGLKASSGKIRTKMKEKCGKLDKK
jgi:hypothetical protein